MRYCDGDYHGTLCPSMYDDDNVECDRKRENMSEDNEPGKIIQMFTFMNQAPGALTESGDLFVLQMKEPEPDSKKVDIFWDHIQAPTAADMKRLTK